MTTPPPPAPASDADTGWAPRAAVLALVRAYQDGGRLAVQTADTDLRDYTGLTERNGAPSAPDPIVVRIAGQIMRKWAAHDRPPTATPQVYVILLRLIGDHAPAHLRSAMQDAVEHLIASESDLQRCALVAEELPGHAGIHLLAAATAAIIEEMPPTTHLTARVVLEQQRRTSLAQSHGTAGVAYIDQRQAAALLLKVVPDADTMTGPAHEGTRLDLHALLQLYLLDHPFPSTPQEDAAVLTLINDRLTAVVAELRRRQRPTATPPVRLSPAEQQRRRRAERERRQSKKKRRP